MRSATSPSCSITMGDGTSMITKYGPYAIRNRRWRAYLASMSTHVDVLIVGAGISGIGAGCHLKTSLPGKTFAILEGRDAIGGTWDIFRYPGIRSDSDLHTFGYAFKPWTSANAIAAGHEILDYLRETVQENDLAAHIRFGHKVLGADWSSADARWTVQVQRDGTDEAIEL